jgi:ADP-heptose:LPS heptosyltransferase
MKGWKEPRSILVSRLRFTGDVILTTPLLEALANRFPGAAIDYLCEEPHDQVLWEHPCVRNILTLPSSGSAKSTFAMIRKIQRRYDWMIDLFGNPRSALLSATSLAEVRIGRKERFPRSIAYSHVVKEGDLLAPATKNHLRLLEEVIGPLPLTRPKLYLSETEKLEGQRVLFDRGLKGNGIGILVGATRQTREWPLENYARLAALIQMNSDQTPVFIGQPGKRNLLQRIRQLSNSQVVVLPEYSLRSLASILMAMRALITADGGVMHMAIALDVPTLAIFGSTEPEIWFPYDGVAHTELAIYSAHCRPCHLFECPDPFCLTSISPEKVFEQLTGLIKRTRKIHSV